MIDKKGKIRGKILTVSIISFLLYVGLLIVIGVTAGLHRTFKLGTLDVRSDSFCGVFTVLQITINIIVVMVCEKTGFYQAIIQNCLSFISLFISVIIKKNAAGVPGIAMMVAGLLLIFILRNYIIRIQTSEKKLTHLAMTDSLTDLPNRRAFNATLANRIKGTEKFAVVFIDLDNFKNINDTMGHDYGNTVLTEVTHRWAAVRGEKHYIARLGGDEFAMIISGYEKKEEVKSLTERYQFCLRDKFVIKDKDFYITASMGVSFYPDDSKDASMLLRYADTAMYNAKQDGKHRISLFTTSQMDSIEADVDSEKLLRECVATESYALVFQPLFAAKNSKLDGFEALVRFKDSDGNMLEPGKYIMLAEKLNFIYQIDLWVIDNAMKQFKGIIEINSDLKVSVNVSVSFLLDSRFISEIKKLLISNSFPPQNLIIEVTESLFVSSLDKSVQVVEAIKELGISVALDDFGTGYASLIYLNKLPIDIVKIDNAFIDKVADNRNAEDFVNAVVSLGHLFGIQIVSEGVETQLQLDKLRGYKCDIVQGYFLGKPATIESVYDLVYDHELQTM